MRVSVIGCGYVGLVTGACLADKGHDVVCVDKIQEAVTMVNNRRSPFYEPGFDELLKRAIDARTLQATCDMKSAIQNTDLTIVAVGTPYKENGIDLTNVIEVCKEIGLILRNKAPYHVVCIKSTVVPSTTDTLVAGIIETASGKRPGEFGLCVNPEFLREGSAVYDFMNPDRIVIGANDDRGFNVVRELYGVFGDVSILRTNLRTAEMTKYAMNCLLAVMISFSNELANIAEATGGVDIKEVLAGVNLDARLNPRINGAPVNPGILAYLAAGCGFGGSCLPKDTKSLAAFASNRGYAPEIVKAAIRVNELQPVSFVERMAREIGDLSQRRIAVLGLSFKPGTDDIRESPAIKIIRLLAERKANVFACDPVATENVSKLGIPTVEYSTDYRVALRNADACVLVTRWPEYERIPPEEFRQLMKTPVVFDGRRVYSKALFQASGIKYCGIGLVEQPQVVRPS